MPSTQKWFRANNLTGGINSISEVNALQFFDVNGTGVQAEAQDIENFMPLNRGGQTKAYGFSLYKSIGGAFISGIYRFTKANGTTYFMIACGKNLYTYTNGILSTVYSNLAANTFVSFETAQNYCIVCDGVNAPFYFDGTTCTTIGNGAPTGAVASVWYQNRLWIFGGSANPNYVYYSAANDITTGYTSNFVQCDYNDGQVITAIAKSYISGNLEAYLLVGKSRSVGVIRGDGSTGNPYNFAKTAFDFGIPGFRQVVQYAQLVAYLTPEGVNTYNTVYNQTRLLNQFLSEKVKNKFQNLNQAVLSNAHCWFDWINNRISYAVTEQGYSYPNVIWHYDYRVGCWYKERWANQYNCTASFIDTDGTWYHGDSAGNVYVHSSGTQTFNGNAIDAYYTTPYLDFGMPALRKRIIQGRITCRGSSVQNVALSTSLDFGDRNGKSNTIPLSAGNYLWGSGQWSSNPSVYQWGSTPITNKKFFPAGWFYSIQFNITQSSSVAINTWGGGTWTANPATYQWQAPPSQPLSIFELDFLVEYEELR
jgi:hypothetical protein